MPPIHRSDRRIPPLAAARLAPVSARQLGKRTSPQSPVPAGIGRVVVNLFSARKRSDCSGELGDDGAVIAATGDIPGIDSLGGPNDETACEYRVDTTGRSTRLVGHRITCSGHGGRINGILRQSLPARGTGLSVHVDADNKPATRNNELAHNVA